MKSLATLILLFSALIPTLGSSAEVKLLEETLEIPASPEEGFHWPYFLRIPYENTRSTLFVIPTNTGVADDDWKVHAAIVRKGLSGDGSRVAFQLGTPVLMPIFPRPKSDPLLYTHALNRRALEIKDKKLARLDLQLIAMIEHARKLLATKKIEVESRVFMLGFSASGMFTSRFALLHPKLIKAAAFGAPGGWPLAPLESWGGKTLRYPMGIKDLKKLTGEEFDAAAFRTVPLYYFLGANDLNDSVIFRDSFEKADEDIIRDLFGNIVPERWEASVEIYKKAGCSCTFKLYPGVGHEMNGEVWRDVLAFFKERL